MTDRDQSEYADSIRRLTLAMQEMLGLGPAAEILSKNEVPSAKGMRPGETVARWTTGGTFYEPARVLAGLAEQTRRDACETVHAMRTPISTIIGYADLLKRWVPPDNAKAWFAIEAINVSADRLNRIVDEAWARALAVANLMQSHRERVVLRELAASIVGTKSAHFVIRDAAIESSAYGLVQAVARGVDGMC